MTPTPSAFHSTSSVEDPRTSNAPGDSPPSLVVGIGASAGGISALRTLLGGLPETSGMAFIVIVHLDPDRDSRLADILQDATSMPVEQVAGPTRLRRSAVYVIPPGRSLLLSDTHVTTEEPDTAERPPAPIDRFFESLATRGECAAAVVLSGAGSDGTLGVRAVKQNGGLVMIQDPEDAEHGGMPGSVLRSGCADVVAPAAALGSALTRAAEYRERICDVDAPEGEQERDADAMKQIFTLLRTRTGHDFSRYKQSTLVRRVGRRMQVNRAESLTRYLEVLRDQAAEAPLLLKDLLISVTRFFRDRAAWAALEGDVIPRLFERRAEEDVVRAWVPGCATGEEAYTLAMLLLAHAATLDRAPEVQVIASDLDEHALAFGREGFYPAAIAADVPAWHLNRFFRQEGAHYRVSREVRERVLFATHSLFRNPPFSRLDLISCRNLLIYLERDLQQDALRSFHYALREQGVLLLGNAESVDAQPDLFEPLNPKHRIYRRTDAASTHPRGVRSPHLIESRPVTRGVERPGGTGEADLPAAERHGRLLEAFAPPSVAVDRAHMMLHLSESAGRFLCRPGGAPTDDVLREVRPELRVDLQEALDDAFESGRPSSRGPLRVELEGGASWVHLIVRPETGRGAPDLALVLFVEGGAADGPEADDESARGPSEDRQLNGLREEARRLRERLEVVIGEYESSKEEMRASNRELQSINEEHKATAEELETSKEELQSVNEELEAVNRELTDKVAEVSKTNSDLRNLMAATDVGTLFLDRALCIQRFTSSVASYFHIRDVDRGRPITDLSHELAYEDLARDARQVLTGLVPLEREIAGPDEKWLLVRIHPYRTVEDVVEGVVATFVDITRRKHAEENLRALTEMLEQRVEERTLKLRRALDLFHDLFHASPAPIAMTRAKDGRLVDANQAYRDLFGYGPQDMKDTRNLARHHWPDRRQREAVLADLERDGRARDVEVELRTRAGEPLTALAFVERISVAGGPFELTVWVDITARKRAEEQVRALASKLTTAEQEERSRVAQVLHDDLQQRLYGARYKLEAIRDRVAGNDDATDALAPLKDVEQWLDDAIEQMRRLTVDLSPPVLEGEGLSEALTWLVEQMREVHGLDVSVMVEKTQKIRQTDQRVMVFQIVRELLFNVVKHSGVMRADIGITEEAPYWRIQVRDEGAGFDPSILDEDGVGGGYGLPHLRERIGLFGGRLELDTAPGKGARVTIMLPMPPDRESERG